MTVLSGHWIRSATLAAESIYERVVEFVRAYNWLEPKTQESEVH